jgi:hypothetical protein
MFTEERWRMTFERNDEWGKILEGNESQAAEVEDRGFRDIPTQ